MKWIGTAALEMIPGEDGRHWRTLRTLAFLSNPEDPDGSVIVEVAPGMETDGASIPRLLWRLIGCPLRGRYAPAAIVHDALYREQPLSRRLADDLFLEMLLDLGVSRWRAWAMHRAVRLGGRAAWSRHAGLECPRRHVTVTRGVGA